MSDCYQGNVNKTENNVVHHGLNCDSYGLKSFCNHIHHDKKQPKYFPISLPNNWDKISTFGRTRQEHDRSQNSNGN